MDIVAILKEHFNDVMTPEVEKKIKDAIEFAISEKVATEKEKLEVELEEEMEKRVAEGLNDIKERLNTYIETANEELINENLKNIESKTKVELAEKMYGSIISCIKENDMTIAVESKDIIAQLEDEKSKLEESLNTAMSTIEEKVKQIGEFEKAMVIKEMTKNLTDTQIEKVVSMVEHVVVESIDLFKEKVESAIEIISEKKIDEKTDDETLDENFEPKVEVKDIDEYAPTWL